MYRFLYLILFSTFNLTAEPEFKSIYLKLKNQNLDLKKGENQIFLFKKDNWKKDFADLSLPVQGAHYCELSRTRQFRRQKKLKIKKRENNVIEFFYVGGKRMNDVFQYASREYNLTLKCKETMYPPIEHTDSDYSLIKTHLKKYFEVGQCLIIENPIRNEITVKGLSLNDQVLSKKKRKFVNDRYKSLRNWVQEKGLGGKRYQCIRGQLNI